MTRSKFKVRLLKLLDDAPAKVIKEQDAFGELHARETAKAFLMIRIPDVPQERLAVNVVPPEVEEDE